MHAAVVHAYGIPIRWESVPDPVPLSGEVLIQVEAVSVNRSLDVEVHDTGAGWPVRRLPFWTGADPSGTVVEVGSGVSNFQPGDRVVVYPMLYDATCEACRRGQEGLCEHFGVMGVHRNGGEAELVVAPQQNVWKLPDEVSFEVASAAVLTYGVAWELLVERAHIGPTDTVLVWGASGGLGSAGIDIARLFGSRIIAISSTETGCLMAEELGAHAVINRTKTDVLAEVMRLTGGRGADVCFENIGSATFPLSLQALAREGRLVTSGSALSGPEVTIDIRQLYRKHTTLVFTAGFSPRWMPTFLELLRTRRINPRISNRLTLEEAEAAQAIVREGRNLGKVVLVRRS
ncbi:MAG: zinc-binding dehydrogenase [Firmicutes bacterium]|nr:zinc-binding dehydrogenase [Bacillota bacterium]